LSVKIFFAIIQNVFAGILRFNLCESSNVAIFVLAQTIS
jgi:hypothetical protein